MTDAELVAALAEALPRHQTWCHGEAHAECCGAGDCDCGVTDALHRLLPVVRRIAEQRAAEELRAVAERFDRLFYDGEAQYADQPESHMKSCALGRNIAYRRAAIRLEARAAALGGKP